MSLTIDGITVTWLGHDGFRIKAERTVYIDPYHLSGRPEPADLLLITHEHSDHLSPDDMRKVATASTSVVTIGSCEAKAKEARAKEVRVVKPGDRIEVAGVGIEATPAYNLNKFRSPGNPFHPQGDGKVGFLLTIAGKRIFHAGDADNIPEFERARGVDVALLPVSGTYVMTPAEAVEAARAIAPKIAVPMHYGAIVGSEADARTFRDGATAFCRVEILTPEG